MSAPIPARSAYEGAGGWRDGRFGQAYDLIEAALRERGVATLRHPLLTQVEMIDQEEELS